MGVIREELVLADAFSSTFGNFISQGDSAIKTLEAIQSELVGLREVSQQSQDFMVGFAEGFSEEFARAANSIEEAASRQKKVTAETQNTANAAGQWASKLRGVIATLGLVKLGENFIETADQMSQINTKLQSLGQNSDAIMAAAQRSRGAYADTANLVVRIGQNASKTFNNEEAIAFAENLNKSFKLAGASQQEMASATLQMTQALGAGALRGEEFNAIMESAPGVIQKIAEYMEVDKGALKDMAADGQITADIIKNAMLGATEEISEEFNNLPMTMEDVGTQMANNIQYALQDAFADWTEFLNSDEGMQLIEDITNAIITLADIGSSALLAIADAIAWVDQNWESLLPIIDLIIAAVLVYEGVQIAAALASAAAWIAANWPLLILIAGIGVAIAYCQSMGVTFQQVGQIIGSVFGTIYAIGYNIVANLWNLIATFAEFFANVFNDPVAAIVKLFTGTFDAILGVVETVAGAIDAVLGSNLAGAVSGFRGKMSSWVSDTYGESAVEIQRMANLDVSATAAEWGNTGANIGNKLDTMNLNMKDISGSLGNIGGYTGATSNAVAGNGGVGKVGSVGKVEQDVKLSDEDLKIYRDLAEVKYMNRIELKTLAPNIKVDLPQGSNLSATDVADAIKAMLIEQSASHTATAHA